MEPRWLKLRKRRAQEQEAGRLEQVQGALGRQIWGMVLNAWHRL
jgi:hypothetical protein